MLPIAFWLAVTSWGVTLPKEMGRWSFYLRDTTGDREKVLKSFDKDYDQAIHEFHESRRKRNLPVEVPRDDAEWAALQAKFRDRVQKFIDERPWDYQALEAMRFHRNLMPLRGIPESHYEIFKKYHLAHWRLRDFIDEQCPQEVLEYVIDNSPVKANQEWGRFYLAGRLIAERKLDEGIAMLDEIAGSSVAKGVGGYGTGSLAQIAERRIFRLTKLKVGLPLPDYVGVDLDGRPMTLGEESKGKVTLVVFWATWCVPCMEMIPHERELLKKHAGKPFTIVGMNGDIYMKAKTYTLSADGRRETAEEVNQRVIDTAAKANVTWRSFRNAKPIVADKWFVHSWPTTFLIDHTGVLRYEWRGDPGEKLDAAVAELVAEALKASGGS